MCICCAGDRYRAVSWYQLWVKYSGRALIIQECGENVSYQRKLLEFFLPLVILPPLLSPSAWFRRDVHLPPLLPQSHQLSQGNRRLHGLSVQKRQGELRLVLRAAVRWTRKKKKVEFGRARSLPWLMFFFCLCAFMQPLIDCTVCYKTYRDQIEQEPKPYVHCVHKMALTQVSLLAAVTNTHSKHGTRLHQIVSDFFSRFTFTSFSWTTGDEDDQSGALQPGGLQQWIPNPPGINRNRVIPRVTRVESNVTPISVSLSCFGAASISTSS